MAVGHLTWIVGSGVEQEVWYKRASDAEFILYDTVAGETTTVDIPDLEENVVYDFQVVAKCDFEMDAASEEAHDAFVTCPELAVEQFVFDLIITFHTVGGEVDKYSVLLYEMPGEVLTDEFLLSPPFGDESVQFTGLVPGTYYKFKVIPSINDIYENTACEITERTLVCPEDYTPAPDGSYCYKIEDVDPDPPSGGTPIVASTAVNTVYSSVGTYIYEFDFNVNGTGISERISLSNSFWVNGPGDGLNHSSSDGPLNRCGLWPSPPINDQDIGFSVCISLPETKVYYIGVGGDNNCRIVIDGVVLVDQSPSAIGAQYGYGASATFKIWHVYPFSLTAGPHIIELIGHNDTGVASMGAEIYNNTVEEIEEADDYTGLNLIFSTKDYRGQPVQLGSNDLGYTCPSGYSLAACEEPIVCRRILTTLPS